MKEYMKSKIELLQNEEDYYIKEIEEARVKKTSLDHPSIASDNYYDRKINYCEYHLFQIQAELNRLKQRLNSSGKSRILR